MLGTLHWAKGVGVSSRKGKLYYRIYPCTSPLKLTTPCIKLSLLKLPVKSIMHASCRTIVISSHCKNLTSQWYQNSLGILYYLVTIIHIIFFFVQCICHLCWQFTSITTRPHNFTVYRKRKGPVSVSKKKVA